MASVTKQGTKWRAQISVRKMRDSAVFTTRGAAREWAERREAEMRSAAGALEPGKTLRDAFQRYSTEVSPKHKGHRWELIRLDALARDPLLPVTLPLHELTAGHFTRWKDARLRQVSGASVVREMSLLSSVLGYCRRDWSWMQHAPLGDVRRPPAGPHRTRVITRWEVRTMLRVMGYRTGRRPDSLVGMVAYAFLLALRTGMRASEVLGMEWPHVHAASVTLLDTKNGSVRGVPLPPKAARLLAPLRGLDPVRVLPVREQTRDALFRKYRTVAGLEGFTFHDSRHTAATRIGATVGQPGRLSFPEFCHVFGWRDPKYALVYVNPSAATLAERMR